VPGGPAGGRRARRDHARGRGPRVPRDAAYEEIEEYLEDEEDYLPTVSEEEFIGHGADDEEAR